MAKGKPDGTCLVVRALCEHVIDAEMVNAYAGDRVFNLWIELSPCPRTSWLLNPKRCRFPIRPAIAMTTHKAKASKAQLMVIAAAGLLVNWQQLS